MGMMRTLLCDRLLRGVLAAFLAYFLVLQAFVGGFSSGAMAAGFNDAGFVICAPSGDPPPDWADGAPGPHDKNVCPCATVCQLPAGLDARPDGNAASILVREQPAQPLKFARADAPDPSPASGLVSDARAPPYSTR